MRTTSELQLLITFKQLLAAQSQFAEIVARTCQTVATNDGRERCPDYVFKSHTTH
jgi:hypothetical protein